MTQAERQRFLIEYMLAERGEAADIPHDEYNRKRLLRSLFNVRMPKNCSDEFIRVQDEYLRQQTKEKGVTDIDDLQPVDGDIYLWQGDITTLKCDAIVNAANSQMLGCFSPCHGCIDNAIHTFAGVQLRAACNELMTAQGYEEPTGQAKITPAYNLPSKYVIHTVGPIVGGHLTENDCELLKSCYLSCLKFAEENGVKSIAFCCISTGVFGFPKEEAAKIAISTVRKYKAETGSKIKVIFNVFGDSDLRIYQSLFN